MNGVSTDIFVISIFNGVDKDGISQRRVLRCLARPTQCIDCPPMPMVTIRQRECRKAATAASLLRRTTGSHFLPSRDHVNTRCDRLFRLQAGYSPKFAVGLLCAHCRPWWQDKVTFTDAAAKEEAAIHPERLVLPGGRLLCRVVAVRSATPISLSRPSAAAGERPCFGICADCARAGLDRGQRAPRPTSSARRRPGPAPALDRTCAARPAPRCRRPPRVAPSGRRRSRCRWRRSR